MATQDVLLWSKKQYLGSDDDGDSTYYVPVQGKVDVVRIREALVAKLEDRGAYVYPVEANPDGCSVTVHVSYES